MTLFIQYQANKLLQYYFLSNLKLGDIAEKVI